MKIRMSFVSNSSSSSFCIIGKTFPLKDVYFKLANLDLIKDLTADEFDDGGWDSEDIEKALKSLGFDCQIMFEDEEILIGEIPNPPKEELKRIEKSLTDCFGKTKDSVELQYGEVND